MICDDTVWKVLVHTTASTSWMYAFRNPETAIQEEGCGIVCVCVGRQGIQGL